MKFTFKIQKYQTEAVDSLVKCFEGQQFADKVQYLRDKGLMPKLVKQEVQTELFEKSHNLCKNHVKEKVAQSFSCEKFK